MQKFAPSASRLPQDGQKFRGGAAARDTDDARTPSSGGDGEAGSPPAPQPNQPRASGAGGAEGAVTGAAAGGAAAGGSAADAAGAPVDATS